MYKLRIASLSLFLGLSSACGSATSIIPDPSNAAHCVAAFTYLKTISMEGDKPNLSLSVQATARALYETRKLKKSGQLDKSLEQGQALVRQYGNDDKVMKGLLIECGSRQDADPTFRTMNENGSLMKAAKTIEAN